MKESNSDESETEWPKQEINATDVDFHKIHVALRYPFLYEDRTVDFLHKYFDDEVLSLVVEQINLYAKQCKLRHRTETYSNEIKAFTRILIGMGVHLVATVDHYWSSGTLFLVQPVAEIMPVKGLKTVAGTPSQRQSQCT